MFGCKGKQELCRCFLAMKTELWSQTLSDWPLMIFHVCCLYEIDFHMNALFMSLTVISIVSCIGIVLYCIVFIRMLLMCVEELLVLS